MRNKMFWMSMLGIFLFIFGVTLLSGATHTLLIVVGGIAVVAGGLAYVLALRKALTLRKSRRR
ncbi:membrane protein [Mycobacterium phage Illumine]|nr:hypothetical protein SEA_DOLE_42 [Mycobacterium phage Dole]UDL14714.1 membrane protein [Mycobacterium phage Devera]UDL14979.1 membrane protein [Mycobacterium phage Illumine]